MRILTITFLMLAMLGCGGEGSPEEFEAYARQYAKTYVAAQERFAYHMQDIIKWERRAHQLHKWENAPDKAIRYAEGLETYAERTRQYGAEIRQLYLARKEGADFIGTIKDLKSDLSRMDELMDQMESTIQLGNNTHQASIDDFPSLQ